VRRCHHITIGSRGGNVYFDIISLKSNYDYKVGHVSLSSWRYYHKQKENTSGGSGDYKVEEEL
jgi:hypothetical protein